MLRLAVIASSEMFKRMRGPLGNRGIDVGYLRAKEFALDLSTPPAESFDVGFVYPTRSMEGGVVTARHGVPWTNTCEDVLISRNKTGIIAVLERAGLPVPRSVYVSNPSDESDLLGTVESTSLDYPVVIKPSSAMQGVDVAKAHGPDSLSGHADVLELVRDFRTAGDKSFLTQEWLPGARDHRAMVLDSEIVGAVKRHLPDGTRDGGCWKHDVYHGTEAVGVALPKSHRGLIGSVADELGVRYPGVDLLGSDGRVVVSETSAQPTIDGDAKYDSDSFGRLAVLVKWVTEKS